MGNLEYENNLLLQVSISDRPVDFPVTKTKFPVNHDIYIMRNRLTVSVWLPFSGTAQTSKSEILRPAHIN